MADTAPRLPETPTADRTTYAPYAVLAVAAVAVAGLFVVILIGLALAAFATKQKIFANVRRLSDVNRLLPPTQRRERCHLDQCDFHRVRTFGLL